MGLPMFQGGGGRGRGSRRPLARLGLGPNGGARVLLTQLNIEGVITFGTRCGGLCAGAGVGLAVLWRVNPSVKQNLFMTGLLWLAGAVCGILLQFVPL